MSEGHASRRRSIHASPFGESSCRCGALVDGLRHLFGVGGAYHRKNRRHHFLAVLAHKAGVELLEGMAVAARVAEGVAAGLGPAFRVKRTAVLGEVGVDGG